MNTTATYTINEEHKGLEVSFTAKPSRETLDSLKAAGFRWHNVKNCGTPKTPPRGWHW